MIKAILFDLDGTLLPMNKDEFVNGYFGLLCKKLVPYGYEPKAVIDGIWKGTVAMIKNNGSKLNEEVFWEVFSDVMGKEILEYKPVFDEFYVDEFKKTKECCGYTPAAREIIDMIKELGCRIICATNPIFPELATRHRMNFAGLDASDFEYFTHYENSRYCKPNPKYFQEVLNKCGLKPDECIMVGNDATEDMAASSLGIKVFLLTDCLINSKNVDLSNVAQGNFSDLKKYILQVINNN